MKKTKKTILSNTTTYVLMNQSGEYYRKGHLEIKLTDETIMACKRSFLGEIEWLCKHLNQSQKDFVFRIMKLETTKTIESL